jgi:hypothetical protein
MFSRRQVLAGSAAALLLAGGRPAGRKRLAVVTTVWKEGSHAWHMAERFAVGYPRRGGWHHPELEIVSAYVDQTPKDDLSQRRASEFGFRIYPTIAEALCVGGERLAVDAVLVIGEHGDYPINAIGQKQYPRYEFFRQVVDVFKRSERTAPVFNDKHLSWKWEWAKEMVDTARSMGFPLLAGSSLPVTWRMPAVDVPYGAPVEEIVCVAFGAMDIYDFHALEAIQCLAERRRGGESGVAGVQGLRGEAVWRALEAGAWDARLFAACLARSQTLAQPASFSHRYPTPGQMREWVREPVAYRVEYNDGLKATMLQLNGLVQDFTLAVRIEGRPEPLSTLFYLPPNPNVVYSAALMSKAEEMFLTGKAPYPVERTLLTSGLTGAGLESLATGQKRIETPHLAVRYEGPRESMFWRD